MENDFTEMTQLIKHYHSQPRQYDGKGGGGAGGMIFLDIESNSGQVLPLSVSGGSGGDVFETLSNSQHGPGGGGGGGVVGLSGFGTSAINANILGGISGTNKLTNDTWGAVNGQSGAILEGVKLFYSANELTYRWHIEKYFDCDLGYEVKACFEGGVITLVGGVPQQNDSCVWIRNIDTIQLVAEIHNGCEIDTFLILEPFEPLIINVLFQEDALCDSSGWIFIEGRGGSPPYKFYINNSESPNGSFDKLVPGEYHISIEDIFGCIKDTILEIEQKITDPPNVELIDFIEPYCVSDYGSLHFRVDTTGIFSLRLFGDFVNKVSDGEFDSLRVGVYFLELIDERGCIYNYGPYQIKATVGGILTVLEHKFCEKDFVINILGDTLFESGVYEIVIESEEDCDSLYIYKIDVIAIDSIHLPIIICEGEVYLYENDTLALPGSYFFSYTNSYGCDSIIIIELTTLNHSKYEDEVFLCFGDSIIYEGLTISTSGVYTFVLTNILGCDSIVVLNVDISELNQTQLDTLICEEQILEFENQQITEEGSYTFILESQVGCDSIIFLSVKYHDSYDCDPCLIYVPNAFSPNGDGINDFFTPIAVTASPIHMIVYNRWGDIVFDSIESFSWNGTFIGSKLNPDVFVYVLSIKCSDGESKTIIGEITLIE
jgi:gliding motility-associated-like protein